MPPAGDISLEPPTPASAALATQLLTLCRFGAPGSAITCGVSGGPDSLALLVLATAAGCRVTAVHVDHGLRPGSSEEASLVAAAAERFGASFRAERAHVAPGPNLEARARAARLAALGEGAATGHTADDQAETVVLNLLRGAGLDGLSGMRPGPRESHLALRPGPRHPILALRRHETVALCAAHGLRPVTDPSNVDPAHRRNRVRHEVMPLLCEVAGRDVVPVLARQTGLLADEADWLDQMAAEIDTSDARRLAAAPPALARRAVRAWLGNERGSPPGAAAVARVLAVAAGEMRACEVEGGVRVSRTGGRLRAQRAGDGASALPTGGHPEAATAVSSRLGQ